MEKRRGNLLLSTDKALLQHERVLHYLNTQTYWAQNMTRDMFDRAVANSLCFGVYDNGVQIAFARLVTDYATFGYLTDVFVDANYRGQGISKWLMEEMIRMPELQGFRRWLLATTDAHELYRRYGFGQPKSIDTYMDRVNPDVYVEEVEE